MEGTLTVEPTLWEIMHLKNGTWESHGLPYWERFKSGALDYDAFARMDVAAWKGAPSAMLDDAVAEVALMPGCLELAAFLGERGIRTAIITNGLECLARRLARELGIDRIEANREIIADGALTGGMELRVPFDKKGEALRRVAAEMGIPLENIMAVGDGVADVQMFRLAGRSVAFRPTSDRIAEAADHVVEEADLRRLFDCGLWFDVAHHAEPVEARIAEFRFLAPDYTEDRLEK